MKKGDIVKSVIEKVRVKRPRGEKQRLLFDEFAYQPLSEEQAGRLVDTLFELIKARLAKGENVLIRGFGKFIVRFKWARMGRNPRTGEPIILNPKQSVTFHCSPHLREKINQSAFLKSKPKSAP